MAKGDEITKAIGVHGLWKDRLLNAIESAQCDFTVANTQRDDLCDFGKWLLSLPQKDQKTAQWKRVLKLHQKFHLEASAVLDLALQGRKKEAKKAMAEDSEFATCSIHLISAMILWLSRA